MMFKVLTIASTDGVNSPLKSASITTYSQFGQNNLVLKKKKKSIINCCPKTVLLTLYIQLHHFGSTTSEAASACIAGRADQRRQPPLMGTGMCSLYRLLATVRLLPELDLQLQL